MKKIKLNTRKYTPYVREADWFEIRRKIFHICLGLIIVGLIYYDILKWWMIFILLIIGLIISLISKKINIPLISWFLKTFEREKHLEDLPGRSVLSIFLGILLSMVLFEKNICLAAIMIWTLGDSASALIGKHFGNKIHPFNDERLIEGTFAGIVVGTIGAMFFVSFSLALIAAVVAMIVESAELRFLEEPIDDNLLVPLVAGGTIVILKLLF